MNDRDRLAHALGRLSAARTAHIRRSGITGPDDDEPAAALAAFEDVARRAGISRLAMERLTESVDRHDLLEFPNQPRTERVD